MHLLTAIINNEELLDELITGWLDIGLTEATVIETTDSLQLISHHVPIFAGFRSLTSGGMGHNKTIFAVVENDQLLEAAIAYLKTIWQEIGKNDSCIYFVTQLTEFGRLSSESEFDEHPPAEKKKVKKKRRWSSKI